LFDIAKLVLNKPERHLVKFTRPPAANGTPEPSFLVMPGESVLLRQDEAVRFALREHAAMIFQGEEDAHRSAERQFHVCESVAASQECGLAAKLP